MAAMLSNEDGELEVDIGHCEEVDDGADNGGMKTLLSGSHSSPHQEPNFTKDNLLSLGRCVYYDTDTIGFCYL